MGRRVEARRSGRTLDEDLDFPRWTVPSDEIDAAVAQPYGIEVQQLRVRGRSAGEAKVVAVELACRLAGLTGRAIGAHYGKISSAAVSTTHRKVRQGKYTVAPVVDSLLIQLTAKRRRK